MRGNYWILYHHIPPDDDGQEDPDDGLITFATHGEARWESGGVEVRSRNQKIFVSLSRYLHNLLPVVDR